MIGPGICQDHFEVGPEVIESDGRSTAQRTPTAGSSTCSGIIETRLQARRGRHVHVVDRCTYCEPEYFFSHRRDDGVDRAAGGDRMANLSADARRRSRANLARIEQRGRRRLRRAPDAIPTSVKHLRRDQVRRRRRRWPSLRDAGVKIAAENRLQDMIAKQERFGDDFDWHFIGAIQSRKIERSPGASARSTRSPRNRRATSSPNLETPAPKLLVQVNVSGEESKQGVAPEELGDFIAATPQFRSAA